MQTLKTMAFAMKHSQANHNIMTHHNTSQHITTHHMRHIFMPVDQTNAKIIYLTQQFVKSNYFNPIHLATKREYFD